MCCCVQQTYSQSLVNTILCWWSALNHYHYQHYWQNEIVIAFSVAFIIKLEKNIYSFCTMHQLIPFLITKLRVTICVVWKTLGLVGRCIPNVDLQDGQFWLNSKMGVLTLLHILHVVGAASLLSTAVSQVATDVSWLYVWTAWVRAVHLLCMSSLQIFDIGLSATLKPQFLTQYFCENC